MPQPQERAAVDGAASNLGAAPIQQAPATHALSAGQHTPVGSPLNAVRGKKLSATAHAAPAPAAAAAAAAEEAPAEDWEEDGVERFVRDVCKLPQYVPAFQGAGIDGAMLVGLTDVDLEELGVANKFHRRKIMQKIGIANKAAER